MLQAVFESHDTFSGRRFAIRWQIALPVLEVMRSKIVKRHFFCEVKVASVNQAKRREVTYLQAV